jgi:hypothetical protein
MLGKEGGRVVIPEAPHVFLDAYCKIPSSLPNIPYAATITF